MRILTTYPIPESKEWVSNTYLVPIRGRRCFFGIRDWLLPIKLLFIRKNFDVIITGAEREDELFALFQTLLVFGKIKHIMIDCLWKKEKRYYKYIIKRILLKLISRSIIHFVVWSNEEKEKYPEEFDLPKGKFIFIPYHHTLSGYKFNVEERDYIFAGGDSSRDYYTLIEAVRDLGVNTVIALRNRKLIDSIDIPGNIRIVMPDPVEFRNLMAKSKIVVVPLKKDLFQSAGQQTYLNAMRMGKPVVVSEAPGVRDYIQHGKTGFIVPPEDINALRDALKKIFSNNGSIKSVVEQAYKKVSAAFMLERFVQRNLDLAKKIV